MFKPMLAATITEPEKLAFPLLASPKFDGIRAVVVYGHLMTRNLKPVPNNYTRELFSQDYLEGLDGELIMGSPTGNDVFNRTTRSVMKQAGTPAVAYYVFDHQHLNLGYHERLKLLKEKCRGQPGIRIVTQTLINEHDELLAYETKQLMLGYEGVMLRSRDGLYKPGRSTLREGYLMKLKRFADAEAYIIGFVEQNANTNEKTVDALGRSKRSSHKAGKVAKGTLGAVLLQDRITGVEFECGTGFTDALRAEIWANRAEYNGKLMIYKFQEVGVVDKPRFPVWKGLRHPSDVS
jgi:DNA ligase-1